MTSIISSAVFLAYSLTLSGFLFSATVAQSTLKGGLYSFGYAANKPPDSHLVKAFHNSSVLLYNSEKNNRIPYRHFHNNESGDHSEFFDVNVNGSNKEQNDNRKISFTQGNSNIIVKRAGEQANANYKVPLKSTAEVLDVSDSNTRATKQEVDSHASDIIINKLGNSGLDSSKGYRDQVIYIPVYDVDHTADVQNTKSRNVVQNVKHAPQPNDEKKAIGFIGVVFLHKVQSNDGSFSAHEKGIKTAGQKGILNSNLQHEQVVYDDVLQTNSPDINALTYALQQAAIINAGSDKTNQHRIQQDGLSINENVNDQAFQYQQPNTGNNDWEIQSQQPKITETKSTQSHSFEDQGRQWQQNNNRNPNKVQNDFISKGSGDSKGTPVTYSSKGQEYPNTRVIPENPLFPPRGGSQQDPSLSDKGKSSNSINNANSAHAQGGNKGMYSQGKSVNWPRGNENKNNFLNARPDQTFKGNLDNTYISDVNKGIANVSPKERPVKFIPVIRHVIVGKQTPSAGNGKFASNDGNFLNQGHIRPNNNLNSHISERQSFLNYNDPKKGTNNNYNKGNLNLVPNKEGYIEITSQNWESQPIVNRHEPPTSQSPNKNNQVILPNHHSRDDTIRPNADHYNDNVNYNNQVKYQNVKSSENFNLSPAENTDFKTNRPLAKTAINTDMKQIYTSNPDLNRDDEIIKALRIANIYLQNYQNNFQVPSKNTEPHHSEAKHLETSEHPDSRNSKSEAFSDNIRPTTDMRFNALVHEKNNFKNVNQNRNPRFPQESNAKHMEVYTNKRIMNDMADRPPEHHGKKNLFPASSPNILDKKMDFDDFQSSSLLENFWQGIQNQNKQQVIPMMAYDGSKAKDVISSAPRANYEVRSGYNTETPNESFLQQENKKLMYDSFQMKDAIIPQYQTKISNKKPEQSFNEQVFPHTISASAAEINPISKDSSTNAKNEATLIFQGYNNKDWTPNSQSDRKAHSLNLQQPDSPDRKVYYQDKSNVGQGSLVSGIVRTNVNGDQHDKPSKVWYKRDLDSKRANAKKEDGNKNAIDYTINTRDADGADSNGFGGESFW